MFALVDGNCFYASCERIFRPDLRTRPIVVLSNNDGCVITRTAEAKALGIKMGVPYFQIKPLVEQGQLVVFSSNYELYGDISKRMMDTIASLAPHIEIYSIDECFADLSGIASTQLTSLGSQMRQRVMQWVGVPTCVGIAPSKTLAKFCNHLAKRHAVLNGVVNWHAWSRTQQKRAMQSESVGEIWGVGRRISKRLNDMGIHTVYDLYQADTGLIRQKFGVTIARTQSELKGHVCIALEDIPAAKQQLIRSRSFSKRLTQLEDIQAAIAHHASDAAKALRKQNSVARILGVILETNPFVNPHTSSEQPYFCHKTITLHTGTANTMVINSALQQLLQQCFIAGKAYKKCGVSVSGIESANQQAQVDLFSLPDSPAQQRLMHCVDQINTRYGKGSLTVATEQQSRNWQMQRGKLSPCFTTRFDELLLVN